MSHPTARRALALAALASLAAALGACRAERGSVTGSIAPVDVRARHPIMLADGNRTLDVFPTGVGHLDPRQAADLDAFMLEFRRYGRGQLLVEAPRGVSPGTAAAVERTLGAIRALSNESGLRGGELVLSGYPVGSPAMAAPIRLSFRRMEAKVASACGLWPNDLGVSEPIYNNSNVPHWNLGCATQSNLASQVADPVDLVRGRPEGRIDTVRRTQDINKLRQGNDPSTIWRQDGQLGVKTNN